MFMLKKFLFVGLLLVLFVPNLVAVDGMVLPPPDYYIWETQQKAVIFYEQGKETLVVSVSFQGNAKDFAWIIPTPSRPQANKASDELFTSLSDLTSPIYDMPRPISLGAPEIRTMKDGQVLVLETQQIEYYDIAVLEATDRQALIDWLNKNGYTYPQSASYILESYIKKGWYFTAVKVNDEYLSQNITGQLRSGHPVPLRLDFLSEKIVYPLKISSVQPNYDLTPARYRPNRQVGILLYVLSDNRQQLPKFITQYAGWVDKATIENLAYDDNGWPWLSPSKDKYFLTKLFRYMSKAEMTNDLFLRQADDNQTVNAPGLRQERGFSGFIVVTLAGGILLLFLLLVLLFSGIRKE